MGEETSRNRFPVTSRLLCLMELFSFFFFLSPAGIEKERPPWKLGRIVQGLLTSPGVAKPQGILLHTHTHSKIFLWSSVWTVTILLVFLHPPFLFIYIRSIEGKNKNTGAIPGGSIYKMGRIIFRFYVCFHISMYICAVHNRFPFNGTVFHSQNWNTNSHSFNLSFEFFFGFTFG